MSRVTYVNGRYLAHGDASVHVEDRGYQFADGVYEVIAVRGGRLVDLPAHLARLGRSLGELRIPAPMSDGALTVVLAETVRRNRVRDGIVYLQATRGRARRDHAFPARVSPALVASARATAPVPAKWVEEGVRVISTPDVRWARCDVKSIALLPNVLAKQAARERGAFEAWQVDDDGFVTEGASTNAWIVDGDGALVTRPAGPEILNGVTRLRLIELARGAGMAVIERPFTLAEAKAAREAFLTSTTAFVLPVTQIDDAVIGNGRPGGRALELRAMYEHFALRG
jgi:D-alanine transaminase